MVALGTKARLTACLSLLDAASQEAFSLDELGRFDRPARMMAMGHRPRDSLDEQARHHGVHGDQSGSVQMPTLLFADDPAWQRGFAFCAEARRVPSAQAQHVPVLRPHGSRSTRRLRLPTAAFVTSPGKVRVIGGDPSRRGMSKTAS